MTEDKLQQIAAYETRGDSLRSNIGLTLYSEMLLPDTSADILGLLSDLDHLLDRMNGHFTLLGIEKPELPADCSETISDFVCHAWVIYRGLNALIDRVKPNLLWLDHWTRLGLVLAGVFGAYGLGAIISVRSWGVRSVVAAAGYSSRRTVFAFCSVTPVFMGRRCHCGRGVFFSAGDGHRR